MRFVDCSPSIITRHFLVKWARPGSFGLEISACLFAVGLFRRTHIFSDVAAAAG